MQGHLLELSQAIAAQDAAQQEREVAEVQETLEEFLSLAARDGRLSVPAAPAGSSSAGGSEAARRDAELFGPFGCGFYGKTRVPGSNACI